MQGHGRVISSTRHLLNAILLLAAVGFSGLLAAEGEYWEYTFRPGDSIWKIAEKYTTSVNNYAEIQKINGIGTGPDRRIRPGERILIPVAMLKIQPTPALVIAVQGGASVVRADGERSEVAVGMKLYSGDRVLTAAGQSLRIQFADKSELRVQQDSEVVLDKLSQHKHTGMVDTRIRLNSGSVETWVEKLRPDSRYQIRTPAAITAVRGTSYRLSAVDGGQLSRTEVAEGAVEVSAGEISRDVPGGFGIVAEKDKPLPEPVKLLPAPAIGDNQSQDMTGLKVSWAELAGAQNYRYQLASDEDFDEVIAEQLTSANTLAMEDIKPGAYYLRVRGIDRLQLEGLDAVRSYEIRERPPVVEQDNWDIFLMTSIFILMM